MHLGQRIMIMGYSGSGKSTLARQLGECLNLPVVHWDTIWWMPNWVERPLDEVYAMHAAMIAEPAWVFEGYNKATRDARAARADTVIFLDLGRGIRVWRVLKRCVTHCNKPRPCMTEGCHEKLNLFFLRFLWLAPRKPKYNDKLVWLASLAPHKRVIILKNRREVKAFLAQLNLDVQPGF
ncbi:MAG: hypothetical protein FWD06_03365 [Oscillospiraceae bacterium]|nr:hypothetical protein [Oscillospiraceae bacterium]